MMEEIKRFTRSLGKNLKAATHPVPHAILLNAVSAALGSVDWRTLRAQIEKATQAPAPVITPEADKSVEPQTIWIATYQHRHGTDVLAFATEELAYAWRTRIGDEWWEEEFPDEPKPPLDEVGEAYFDMMSDEDPGHAEYFGVEQSTLQST